MNLRIYKIKKNQLTKKNTKNIYLFLTKNIKNSVFTIFGHDFFLKFLKINHLHTFYIKKNNNIVSYISYINRIDENKLKKKLFFFILKNFFFNFVLIILNYQMFFKMHTPPNDYIQLFHLIVKVNKTEKKIKSILHKKIEHLNQMVSYKKYKGVYAIYQNNNVIAARYYDKNNFKIFKKNFFYTFVKKKI